MKPTNEMIAAARSVLWSSGRWDYPSASVDDLLVAEMLSEALAVAKLPLPRTEQICHSPEPQSVVRS